MIHPNTAHPEADVHAAEFDYTELLGWPVTLTGSHLVATPGPTLLAVQLPAELGEAAQHVLRLRMQDGPVLEPPGHPEIWVFLTAPYPGAPERVPRRLDRPDVQLLTDQPVLLPPSRTPRGYPRWVTPPSLSRPWLPPVTALATALTLTNREPQP
ncbi:MAG: hypothetical protein M3R63_10580 [Actinomycetota bacterium]|nr:hypothetical protein [Actinomycetota bacterium]